MNTSPRRDTSLGRHTDMNNPYEEVVARHPSVTAVAEDSELIHATVGGDDEAFSLIVLRYQERVFNLAYRMVQDFDDAHDVAQETFIRAHAKIGSFREGSTLFTWLYRIALNSCINLLRKNKLKSYIRLDFWTEKNSEILVSENVFAVTADQPDVRMEATEIRARLLLALGKLPPRQRSVFVLRQFDGLTHHEIADVVGCTEGSVRASYYHAIKKLRGALCDLL